MYEHAREETGRPAPPRPVQAARIPSAQLPVAAAIAAYTPSSTPAAAPTPSYQEYESESEDSEAVLDTPGEASHTSPHHAHHQQRQVGPPPQAAFCSDASMSFPAPRWFAHAQAGFACWPISTKAKTVSVISSSLFSLQHWPQGLTVLETALDSLELV